MDAKGRTALDLAVEMRNTTIARAMVAEFQLSPRVYFSDSFAGTIARLVTESARAHAQIEKSTQLLFS